MRVDVSKQKILYQSVTTLLYIAAALSWTGVSLIAPQYIALLNMLVKVYVAGFLLVRFNPWVPITTGQREFDRSIGFQAGVFMLYTIMAPLIGSTFSTFKSKKREAR